MSAPYQVMPELSGDALRELAESIGEHGVLVPVLVDEEGTVIDGHHRQLLADSLGIEYPVEMREGLTEAEKRTLAFELNNHRRQLTTEARRALITRSLKADPELSDRAHARRCACDNKTVATVRASLVRRREIPDHVERKTSDGRKFPASKPNPSNEESPQCSDESAGQDPTESPTDDPAPPADGPVDEAPQARGGQAGAGETSGDGGGNATDPEVAPPPAPAPSFASVGELIDWCPDSGQWLTYDEMQRTAATKHFGTSMNRRLPRSEDQDIAGLCPPEARRSAIFAAEVAATYWLDLAADLKKLQHPSTEGRHLAAVEG